MLYNDYKTVKTELQNNYRVRVGNTVAVFTRNDTYNIYIDSRLYTIIKGLAKTAYMVDKLHCVYGCINHSDNIPLDLDVERLAHDYSVDFEFNTYFSF